MHKLPIYLLFILMPCGVLAADISVGDLERQQQQVTILDVRTPGEFQRGHIEGAINLSVQADNFREAVSRLDPNAPYVVHCAVNPPNGRGDTAIDVMESLGFTNVRSLSGGYNAWATSGRRVSMGRPTD